MVLIICTAVFVIFCYFTVVTLFPVQTSSDASRRCLFVRFKPLLQFKMASFCGVSLGYFVMKGSSLFFRRILYLKSISSLKKIKIQLKQIDYWVVSSITNS